MKRGKNSNNRYVILTPAENETILFLVFLFFIFNLFEKKYTIETTTANITGKNQSSFTIEAASTMLTIKQSSLLNLFEYRCLKSSDQEDVSDETTHQDKNSFAKKENQVVILVSSCS